MVTGVPRARVSSQEERGGCCLGLGACQPCRRKALRGRGEGERAGAQRLRAQVGADPRSGVGTAGGRDPGQASPERRRAGQALGPHNLCGMGAALSLTGPPQPAGASRGGGCPAVGAAARSASQGLQISRIAKEKKKSKAAKSVLRGGGKGTIL